MQYYVSNKPGELGKTVQAEDPEAAAAQSKLKGDLEIRWNVKFGEPGLPSTKESGPWWFANSATLCSGKPALATAPPKEDLADVPIGEHPEDIGTTKILDAIADMAPTTQKAPKTKGNVSVGS